MRLDFLNSRLVRAGLSSAVLRFVATGLTLAVSVLLARLIGPEGMGYYAFAMSVVALAGLPTQMGLPILVLRETAKAEQQSDWATMHGIWAWAARRIIRVAVFLLPVIALGGWLLEGRVVPEGGVETLWAALPMIAFFAAAQLRASALRGLNQPSLGLIPDGIVRPCAQLFGLVLLTPVIQQQLQPHMAALVNVVASALAFLVGSLFLYRAAPKSVWNAVPKLSLVKEWRSALLPLALVSGAFIIMQNLNIVILGMFRPVEDVGFFRIALSAATMVTFGMTVVNFVVASNLAKLHVDMELEHMAKTAQISSAIALTTALPVVLILVFLGSIIITQLYGDVYRDAYPPLAILACSKLILTAYSSCGSLLNMSGHEREVAVALVVGVAVNAVLAFALCPSFGSVGAAFATLGSTLIWNAILAYKVKSKLGFSGSAFPALVNIIRRK